MYASLDKQYNKNFEWMIVDDGSTDDTAQVVKELQDPPTLKSDTYIREMVGSIQH